MVCFRFLSVHANIFPLVSKLATFVNILAKYVFARSYYGNKMAHFVSARKYDNNCWHYVSDYVSDGLREISVTDHLRKVKVTNMFSHSRTEQHSSTVAETYSSLSHRYTFRYLRKLAIRVWKIVVTSGFLLVIILLQILKHFYIFPVQKPFMSG